MKRYTSLTSFLVLVLFITSCGQKFKQAEYSSSSGMANSEQETVVNLEDGASISIPTDSVEGDVTVIVERNPEKTNSLPPLPEGFVPISDFYNFEISEGKLVGPVDITMPIYEDLIPEGNGMLVAAFPTEDGWEYRPVFAESNKVTIYTDQLGDPLIAWHFTDEKNFYVCDPGIAVNVVPNIGNMTDDFQIVGRLKPLRREFYTFLGDKLASLVLGQEISSYAGFIPLEIEFNGDKSKTISGMTKSDGTFEITINPEKYTYLGLRDGVNRLKVTGACNFFTGSTTSTSVGYSSFEISSQAQATEALPVATEPPVSQPEPISPPQSYTGKIPVPNVVGMSFENARETLENLGFNTTWIDGVSTFEIGQVYAQSPTAGKPTVPHRTTVVLYRTTEKLSECDQLNLTSEECANMGTHKYKGSGRVVECSLYQPNTPQEWDIGEVVMSITFTKNAVDLGPRPGNSGKAIFLLYIINGDPSSLFIAKQSPNIYQFVRPEGEIETYTIRFHSDGFEAEYLSGPFFDGTSCTKTDTFVIVDSP